MKEKSGSGGPAPRLVPVAPHDEIAARAYRYYLERGMEHGHHVEDWLRAEKELREQVDGEKMAEAA